MRVHQAAKAPDGFSEALLVHTNENGQYTAGDGWHTDVSCDATPPGRPEVTPSGRRCAKRTTSLSFREYRLTVTAVHSGDQASRGRYGARDDDKEYPVSEDPVIRTHPISGRKALSVNSGFTQRIRGLSRRESDGLLRVLYNHIAYGIRFQDPVPLGAELGGPWDNRCVQHRASWNDDPETRPGYRVTTRGEVPFR